MSALRVRGGPKPLFPFTNRSDIRFASVVTGSTASENASFARSLGSFGSGRFAKRCRTKVAWLELAQCALDADMASARRKDVTWFSSAKS